MPELYWQHKIVLSTALRLGFTPSFAYGWRKVFVDLVEMDVLYPESDIYDNQRGYRLKDRQKAQRLLESFYEMES